MKRIKNKLEYFSDIYYYAEQYISINYEEYVILQVIGGITDFPFENKILKNTIITDGHSLYHSIIEELDVKHQMSFSCMVL